MSVFELYMYISHYDCQYYMYMCHITFTLHVRHMTITCTCTCDSHMTFTCTFTEIYDPPRTLSNRREVLRNNLLFLGEIFGEFVASGRGLWLPW